MSHPIRLQAATYLDFRSRFGLPAQLACHVPRHVGATYRALWARVNANTAARQAGRTKQRDKDLDQPPTDVSPTLTYNSQRDFSLKFPHQVSILTLGGRVVLPYNDTWPLP